MKSASIVVSPYYQNNQLFNLDDPIINRDNCMHPFFMLQQKFLSNGYILATQDIHSIEDSDVVIYNEMPEIMPKKEDVNKSYLLLFESELIRPDNWDLHKHTFFTKIFTWNDDFVDEKKYVKFNFSQDIPTKIERDSFHSKKLCTLIAGNKMNHHPLELYSKRVEAIEWFESYHLTDFDFYGIGWDDYRISNKYINFAMHKLPFFKKILVKEHSSYKGRVDSKKNILQKYKFAICYENARDIPGYITEKIFDCLFAGCIPIYWGANNIDQYVPSNCFIDKRDFDSYEELYSFISSMPKEVHEQYVDNIETFIKSEKIFQFSAEYFAEKIVQTIVNEK